MLGPLQCFLLKVMFLGCVSSCFLKTTDTRMCCPHWHAFSWGNLCVCVRVSYPTPKMPRSAYVMCEKYHVKHVFLIVFLTICSWQKFLLRNLAGIIPAWTNAKGSTVMFLPWTLTISNKTNTETKAKNVERLRPSFQDSHRKIRKTTFI